MRGTERIKFPKWDGTELCAKLGPALFYDDNRLKQNEARENLRFLKELCSQCPRLNECREYAIKHEEFGFWGGMSMTDRKLYRTKHKIKLRKPELESDYTPIYERTKSNDNFNNG